MWLRLRSAEFIHQLLAYPLAEEAWTRSMKVRRQPTSRLAFCCAVAQLDNIDDPGAKRTALFELAERYLGLRDQLQVGEVEARVKKLVKEMLSELSLREFGHFLASNQCSELIFQLRLLDAQNLYLTPPPTTSETELVDDDRPTTELVRVIDAALKEFPAAVLLCDRALGGLPIVSCSAGVQRLTVYPANEMLGWNCRMRQGPESDLAVVNEVIEAIRNEKALEVSIINYRKDGRPFTNLLSIGHTLRILPGTELIAAVLRCPPPPLQAARSDAETSELLAVLASCNGPRTEMLATVQASGLPPKTVAEGEQWMLDAEATLNRMLRLPRVRGLYLRTALQSPDGSGDEPGTGSKTSLEVSAAADAAMDQALLAQRVQLMMHSDNVLYERDHYLKTAVSLWSELSDLQRVEGWEYRAALSALVQKYVVPDRGSRRHSTLWRGLRTAVYDPMSMRERELRDPSADEQPTTQDLLDAMEVHEVRSRRRVGSLKSKSANEAIQELRARSMIKIQEPDEDADEGAMSEEAEEEAADELPPDELLEVQNEVIKEEKEKKRIEKAAGAVDRKSDYAPSETGSVGSRRSGYAPSGFGESRSHISGSQTSSITSGEESLRDLGMLQHVLLRILSIQVLPTFLASMGYAEAIKEVRAAGDRSPLYALLEVELQSILISQPATSEAWAGVMSAAVKFLPHAVLLCDLSLPGVPIVSVNAAFELLTGWGSSECVGRNCRFLQGAETDPAAVVAISTAIRTHTACHVSIVNYKKDGSTFLNLLSLKPVFDCDGLGRYMLGCIVEVHDQYSATKAQLRHVDRLLKLTESHLGVPSSAEARSRMPTSSGPSCASRPTGGEPCGAPTRTISSRARSIASGDFPRTTTARAS